jgi:micrococcal nuclease
MNGEKFEMYEYKAKVIRILDGDTIEAIIDLGFGVSLKKIVRLEGIDAPEIRTRSSEIKAKGIASRDYLSNLINDKLIIIKTKLIKNDKFGRILGIIHEINSNVSVNSKMISEGYAVKYDL